MTDYRAELLEWAKREIGPQTKGSREVERYWRATLPPDWSDAQVKLYAKTKDWCGGFCLAGLKAVGLAKDVFWIDSKGFLGPAKLRLTRTPSRGDIGFIAKPYQHHLLFDYEYDGKIHSVDGNQPDVREKSRSRVGIDFYSIQPLIDAVSDPSERDTLPVPKRPTVWQGHCPPAVAMEIQTLLNGKGFPLKVDGVFGKLTAEAVRKFKVISNLTGDGIVGDAAWQALLS